MKSFLYNLLSRSKIALLKATKSELNVLMFDVIDEYFKYQSKKVLHQDAIASILKGCFSENDKILTARKYVFSTKNDTDKNFEQKFGKRGKYMAELNKLIQIIFFLKNDISPKNEVKSRKIRTQINKDFNKITLHMYEKYDI